MVEFDPQMSATKTLLNKVRLNKLYLTYLTTGLHTILSLYFILIHFEPDKCTQKLYVGFKQT